MGHRLSVRPVAGHRVIGVYDNQDAAFQRELLTLQTERIPSTVPPFVVLQDPVGELGPTVPT